MSDITLTDVATGDIIEAAHINKIYGVLSGTAGYGFAVRFTKHESASVYALDVQNVHATSLGLRVMDSTSAVILAADSTSGVSCSQLTFTPAARTIASETSILSAGSATYTGSTSITTQRFYLIGQPTLAFTSAQTTTTAATLAIADAPAAGSNATLTNTYALWVQAGITRLVGAVSMGSTLAVTGAATLSSLAAGNTTITGTLSVSLTAATGNLTVTGTASISSTLTAGNTTITGTASISSTLAAGATTITGALSASGAVTFNSMTVGTTVLTVGSAATTYTTNMFDITCGGTNSQVMRILVNANQVFAVDGNGVTAMGNPSVTPSRLISLIASGLGTDMINASIGGVVKWNVGTNGQQAIAATTNQFVLGTTNTTTFSATAPSSSRTVTFADPGGNDSVVYLAATQTLTNKTLTSPKIVTSELDANGQIMWAWTATSGAVDYITVANQATGAATSPGVSLAASGSDSNISFSITPAGTGTIFLGAASHRVRMGASSGLVGFLGATPVVQVTCGATLTNSVTSGGSANVIADVTDITTYSNAGAGAAIRNDLYQLSASLKIIQDALRLYGLLS